MLLDLLLEDGDVAGELGVALAQGDGEIDGAVVLGELHELILEDEVENLMRSLFPAALKDQIAELGPGAETRLGESYGKEDW